LTDRTHEQARAIVEFYLKANGKVILNPYEFHYPPEFIERHNLGTTSRPNTSHTYDILTAGRIIEIDDLKKHSKKNQKINDGIATDYAALYQSHMKFHRLLKEEIVDEKGHLQPTAAEYLKENLF